MIEPPLRRPLDDQITLAQKTGICAAVPVNQGTVVADVVPIKGQCILLIGVGENHLGEYQNLGRSRQTLAPPIVPVRPRLCLPWEGWVSRWYDLRWELRKSVSVHAP